MSAEQKLYDSFNRAARWFFKRAGGETVYDELVAPYFRQNHARLKAAALVCTAFLALPLAVASNSLMGELITGLTTDHFNKTIEIAAKGGVIALFQIGSSALTNKVHTKLANDWLTWTTDNCIEHICKKIPPAPFLTETPRNEAQSSESVSSDLNSLVWNTLGITTEALSTGSTLLAFSYVLNQISPAAFLGISLLTAASVGVPYIWKKKMHDANKKLIDDATTLRGNIDIVERSSLEITAMRGREREEENLKKKNRIVNESRSNFFKFSTANQAWNRAVFQSSRWICLLPFLNQKTEAGLLSRTYDATSQVLFPIQQFMAGAQQRMGWSVSVSRLENLLTRSQYLDPNARTPQYQAGEEESVQIENLTIFAKDCGILCRDVSFTLRPGDRLALTGDPGSGKTTLLRQMAGCTPIFDGNITFTGLDGNKDVIVTPQTSYTPQMSFAEALAYPRKSEDFTREQMEDALRKSCLDKKIDFLNDPPGQTRDLQHALSGGEQQYFNIARILLHKPAFIGLDEPTAAMGPKNAIPLLKTIIKELPDSIIITSLHDTALIPLHNMNAHIEDNKLTFRPIRKKPNIREIRLKQVPLPPYSKGP